MLGKNKPILPGAVFCNFSSQDESGKINCRDVFTSFLAWAYPTSVRTWHAILPLYNLPIGTSTITAAISFGRGKKETLGNADIDRGKQDIGNIISIQLFYKFKQEGNYTVYFNLVGSTTVLKVPLKVITQPWPKFTNSQLEFLRKNPTIPHSIRMNVLCSKCSRPYVFEESVLPNEKLADGVMPFPETGMFTCESCGHEMHMKDIQGQLRNSISNAISSAKQGRK
jgi:hypothetical protein